MWRRRLVLVVVYRCCSCTHYFAWKGTCRRDICRGRSCRGGIRLWLALLLRLLLPRLLLLPRGRLVVVVAVVVRLL